MLIKTRLNDTCDASGNAATRLGPVSYSEYFTGFLTLQISGQIQATFNLEDQAGFPFGGSTGKVVALGPLFLAPGEWLILNTSDATPGATLQGTLIGDRNPDPAQLVPPPQPVVPPSNLAPNRATAFSALSRPAGTYKLNIPRQYSIKGLIVYINVAGITGTLTVSIWDFDDISGLEGGAAVLSTVALGASATLDAIRVYPGIAVVANATASFCIGQTPQIRAVSSQTDTWSIDYDLLP